MAKSKSLPDHALVVRTYADLENYAHAFAEGHLNLLFLCGAPGIGKSQHVRRAIGDRAAWIDGNASPFGIYLWAHEHRDRPLVLDDATVYTEIVPAFAYSRRSARPTASSPYPGSPMPARWIGAGSRGSSRPAVVSSSSSINGRASMKTLRRSRTVATCSISTRRRAKFIDRPPPGSGIRKCSTSSPRIFI